MNSTNYNFQKLTPTSSADLKIYEDALNFVFSENDLQNIAITGSYSAGKSSILETYKKQHPEKRFLHISLAHFESTTNEEKSKVEQADVKKEPSYREATLEGKILNQLIHQIDPDKIPQTHFKVKEKVSNRKMWLIGALITSFIVSMTCLLNFSRWNTFVQGVPGLWLKNILNFTTNNTFAFFIGSICVAFLAYTIYSIIKIQHNKNMFKKISVQGNGIEIFASEDQSYFDKYLNEVLYLFENADAHVFVFEDMDRYNSNRIFEKLREINYLINKKSDTTIRFCYLLRDDVFVSKDRTKFFDFIIPIVPIIDSSNSYDQFIDHFKKGGILDTFNLNFLQGLSLYIDDMRILKNIYNEYVMYYKRIQLTDLNCNKLLAIITYKNLFPRDFSELQLGRGFVHCLFNNKPHLIGNELKRLEQLINESLALIKEGEKELAIDINELEAIYFIPKMKGLNVNGKYVYQFSSRAEFINEMKNDPHNIQGMDVRNYVVSFDLLQALDELHKKPEFVNRKKRVEAKSTDAIARINQKLQELQKKKRVVEREKIQDIISKENIDEVFGFTYANEIGEVFNFADVKSSAYFLLIKYLIRNGYIDETYPDYMTYFYEHSLSRVDKIFLRSVTDQVAKEFTYELKNSALVISRLRDIDFEHEEILNFNILCHLLKSKNQNLNVFIHQLKNKSRLDFVSQFWNTRRETAAFIKLINYIWPRVWKEILRSDQFSDIQRQQYAVDTLYYSPNEDIKSLNINNIMTTYISNNKEFLNINEPDVQLIISKLNFLKVKFKQINYDRATPILFRAVYEAELYELNILMITLILNTVYNLTETEDYRHKSYTLIISQPEECLVSYIKDNIGQYMELILNYCNSKITDSEEAALEILNNYNLSIECKLSYIQYLKTIIEKIESIADKQLWPKLLQQQIVVYKENNILQYYFNSNNKLDANLIAFINADTVALSFNYYSIEVDFGEGVSAFYQDIILCNNLTDEKYDMVLCNFKHYYGKFTFEGILESKVIILITYSIIQMNVDNLEFMRENYPNNVRFFIQSNIEKYVDEAINDKNFSLHESLFLLEEKIADSLKLKLLNYTSEAISVKQKEYSELIKLHVLGYNFDIGDLSYLIQIYDQETANIKIIIRNICISSIDQITGTDYHIPFNLLMELFSSEQVETASKIGLLIKYLPKLAEERTKACMGILQMKDYLSLFDGRRPKFERNDENETMLAIFRKRGWITGFTIDKDDSNYFRARGRRSYKNQTEVLNQVL